MSLLNRISRSLAGVDAIELQGRFGTEVGKVWRYFVAGFVGDNCAFAAGALTYTSLLALVPLMTVTLSVLAAFPVFESVTADLQNFVFQNFVPAAGEVVAEHLQNFAQKASQLTAAGIIFLLVTAVMLMANIDNALNAIFKVRAKRRALASFLVYWAVLTLGPLLLGASLVMTSYVVSVPLLDDAAASVGGRARLLSLLPYVAEALAFGLLYMVVPNRSVRWRHALAGGLLAALLFETAKRLFAWYVTSFPTYEAIYGALAAVPIFLIWIYLSWLVILIGAEFTFTLGVRHHGGLESESGAARFLVAFDVLRALWTRNDDGGGMRTATLVAELEIAEPQLAPTLELLVEAKLITRSEAGEWVLIRDLHRYPLRALYRRCDPVLPAPEQLAISPRYRVLADVLRPVGVALDEAMRVPVAEVFEAARDIEAADLAVGRS